MVEKVETSLSETTRKGRSPIAENFVNHHNNPKLDIDKIRTNLTGISIFIMGIIDAYAVIVEGTLVSAQTGNLVTLSRELVKKDWSGVWKHIIVFIGFAMGAFLGKAVQEILKRSWMRFRMYLIFQSVLLLFLSILQTVIPGILLVFLLSVLAGYDLALFRNFRNTRVNNGVMTGNTKDLMSHVFTAIYYKDKKAWKHCADVGLAIFIFVAGVGVGSALVVVNQLLNLWVCFFIVTIYIGWLGYLNVK